MQILRNHAGQFNEPYEDEEQPQQNGERFEHYGPHFGSSRSDALALSSVPFSFVHYLASFVKETELGVHDSKGWLSATCDRYLENFRGTARI